MKKILISFSLIMGSYVCAQAQQLARARYVNIVTTTSSPDTLNIVSKGGISLIGSTSFAQHGKLTLLSNPVSGNSDWLDSTTGVITPLSTGMVSFKGVTATQNITGPTTFYGLTIEGAGVNLNQSNEVRNQLNLNNGLIYITNRDDSIYVSNPVLTSVSYTVNPFTTTSWVHGKLSRRAITAGAIYEFPIGKILGDSLYAPLKVEKQNGGGVTYSAQYFPQLPINRSSRNPYFHHISELEFWEITSHNFAIPADNYSRLSLSWRTYSDVSLNPTHWDSLVIAHYIDPAADDIYIWEPEINAPIATIEPGSTFNFGYFHNAKFIGDFTMPHLNFTIGTRTINNALPVNLLSYQVQLLTNQKVLNSWKIINDVPVDHYKVERSTDMINYSPLGNIVAARTSGTNNYTFTDPTPAAGWNYYRLKIVENTREYYSAVRTVFIGRDNQFTLFPNPAQDHIFVNLPPFTGSQISLSLIDNQGRLISTITPQSTTVRLTLTKLAAGLYYIRYQSGKDIYSKPFIHQ